MSQIIGRNEVDSALAEFENVLDAFEASWQNGRAPEISKYVERHASGKRTSGSSDRDELLAELIKIDLEYRWRQAGDARSPKVQRRPGRRTQLDPDRSSDDIPRLPHVGDYLHVYPELTTTDELLMELIGEEYRVEQRWGDRPSHDDYVARYGKHADKLRPRLSEIDREIDTKVFKPGLRDDLELPSTQYENSLGEPTANLTSAASTHVYLDTRDADRSASRDDETLGPADSDPTCKRCTDVLMQAKPFSEFPVPITYAIATRMADCEFAVGEPLTRQGEPGEHLFVLVEGVVEVSIQDDEHLQRVVERVGPGSVIGEFAFLTNQSYIADVEAITPVRVLSIPFTDLRRIARQYPPLEAGFAHLVAARLGRADGDVFYNKDINGYRIKRPLGRGAMSVVYEAEDQRTGERVALKMMSHRLAYDHEAVKRFQREGEIVSTLRNCNIARIDDCFAAYGTFFIVMEYCDGPTLSRVIRKNAPLPERQVRAILGQLAGALIHAHQNGVVHRDLKPANIMVQSDGTVKLCDFGLATSFLSTALTTYGQILGTPRYMPPEQRVGSRVDKHADIYALGCIAYELLTGESLFTASDTMELLLQQMHWAPSKLLEIVGMMSEAMFQLLSQSLAVDPNERVLELEKVACWSASVDLDVVSSAQGGD